MNATFKIFATSAILGLGIGVAPANATTALVTWVDSVEAQIDDTLSYPGGMINQLPAGRVSVGFTRGADGTPVGVSIKRSSGSAILDAEAIRTVRRLRDLAPLPVGFDASTPVRVELAFGVGTDRASEGGFERDVSRMRVAARAINARSVASRTSVEIAGRL